MTRHRNKKGEILCGDCGGDGSYEIVEGHVHDPSAPTHMERCQFCGGTGLAECTSAGCDRPATIEGAEDPRFLYCSREHAHEDENWPSCLRCQAQPQDPECGPFCSPACESIMLTEIQRRQLERWRAKIAIQNEEIAP